MDILLILIRVCSFLCEDDQGNDVAAAVVVNIGYVCTKRIFIAYIVVTDSHWRLRY